MARYVDTIGTAELEPIIEYLDANNLGVNKYRTKVGEGVSQCLGIVSKRSAAPDLSRQSWLHPRLHYMLMEFGERNVRKHIDWTSIQVNCNYTCAPHKDNGNIGESYIIAFGDYTDGAVCIEDVDYPIHQRGLLFDGSQLQHWTRPWTGTRYSIVYHTIRPRFPAVKTLSDYTAVVVDGSWKIRCSDGGYMWKGHGLPHPLKGRKKQRV